MIRISVNVLTAIQMLMHKSIKYEISNEELLWSVNSSQIDTAWIIATAHKCKWIDRQNKVFQLTSRGYSLFANNRTYCHITANEWHTAQNSKCYKFYFWLIGASNKLATLDPYQIAPYIPTNNATGTWESVKIPFSSFSEHFKNTNIKDGDLL